MRARHGEVIVFGGGGAAKNVAEGVAVGLVAGVPDIIQLQDNVQVFEPFPAEVVAGPYILCKEGLQRAVVSGGIIQVLPAYIFMHQA